MKEMLLLLGTNGLDRVSSAQLAVCGFSVRAHRASLFCLARVVFVFHFHVFLLRQLE